MIQSRLASLALLTALFTFAGCSTPSERTVLADGSQGYRITCGGAYSSVKDCYERAGYVCGNKGYSVVRELDIAPPSDSDYFWNAAAHETIIKCNGPK